MLISCGSYNSNTGSLAIDSSRGFPRNAVKPDFTAPGVEILGPLPRKRYGRKSGTSVSGAITAGIAALMLEWGIMQKNDMQSAFDLYMAGSGSYATSQTYTKEMYNASPAVVTPGSTHLIPLAKTLEAALSDPMNDYVAGDVERPLKITAEASFQTWQSGKK